MYRLFRLRFVVPLLLLATVMLTGGLIPTIPFGSDEGDNILGAFSVLSGGDIYKAFYSQHMPFGYYFTALFALCGAESILEFRIAYLVFMAFFWTWLCWSYARRIPAIMLTFILIAFPLSAPFFIGHIILADNLSGLALLVLLLELISHSSSSRATSVRDCGALPPKCPAPRQNDPQQKADDLTPKRIAVISLASFTAVTACFLSVYPVFAFVVSLLLLDLRNNGWRLRLFPFRQYILLATAMVFPFAVLLGWYALTGNLVNFYHQAYEFNRTFYPKYVAVGYPYEPVLKFVILPLAWIQHIDLALKTAFHSRAFSLDLLLVLGNLGFVVFIRRGWAFSVALFLFLIYTGTRSFGGCVYTGFHSAPYFIVSLASLGWLIAFFCEPRRARILVTACLLVLFLKCTIPVYLRVTWPVYKRCLYSNQNLDAVFSTPYDRELKALTRPGDMIWSAGVNAYVYINNRCRPAGRVWGLVPWFADSYMDKIIADLERYKPKVIIFPSDGMVWGQALKDFGADIQRYIQPRYHPLDANVPVKKDIYILNNLPPSMP